jgi:hypothetical protein
MGRMAQIGHDCRTRISENGPNVAIFHHFENLEQFEDYQRKMKLLSKF